MKNIWKIAFTMGCSMLFLGSPIFASDTPFEAPPSKEMYSLSKDKKADRYVIVYKVNGHIHAVIINRYVCCPCLIWWNENAPIPTGVQILDCGPVGQVSPPSGSTTVDEASALSHFGLDDWPTKKGE